MHDILPVILSGGSGTRRFGNIAPGDALGAFGVVRQSGVEFGHALRCGTFLRPKNSRRAARTTKWVIHIAGYGNLGVL